MPIEGYARRNDDCFKTAEIFRQEPILEHEAGRLLVVRSVVLNLRNQRLRQAIIVPCQYLRAARQERPHRRRARSGEAQHRVFLAGEGLGRDHRSFSVARPASASTKLMIQKRITTVGSDQPRCSKWWWIGAIRNTRFPVRL